MSDFAEKIVSPFVGPQYDAQSYAEELVTPVVVVATTR